MLVIIMSYSFHFKFVSSSLTHNWLFLLDETEADDEFVCSEDQSHIVCQCCLKLFPRRTKDIQPIISCKIEIKKNSLMLLNYLYFLFHIFCAFIYKSGNEKAPFAINPSVTHIGDVKDGAVMDASVD